MGRKESVVEPVGQRVNGDFLISGLEYNPSQVRRWFSDNVIKPVFGHIIGVCEGRPVRLSCTSAGILRTATTGTGLSKIAAVIGVAGAVESAAIPLPRVAARIRVHTTHAGLYVRTSVDGVIWWDQICIEEDGFESIEIAVKFFKVMREGINDSSYRIEAYD